MTLQHTLLSGPESPSAVSFGGFPVAEWNRYEFLHLLGQGGMGAVYKARDKILSRTVALKFIRGGDPNMIMRFLQEARTQARIDHPNVCKVYEVGEVQGQAYIAMQYVDGKSLDRNDLSLSLTEKVVIMRQVAEAMHEAHRLGVIHRDIKPANIMLERADDGSWNPIVMDFGLAREADEGRGLTETGTVLGTPAYMSPEQARGESRSMDRRSDVYSIGATLYDLIAGTPPFDAESIVDILLKVVNEDPQPLHERVASIPLELETIVMKCLNKEPTQRYDSARALAQDLERYLNGEPILGRRLSMIVRMKRQAQRHRTLVVVSALFILVVLFLGIGALRQYVSNQRERRRLEAQARIEQQLAQRLGQEITQLEWVLRSARQLPLHDLSREKVIVRERMAQLQSELKTYGDISRGLGHYALGRGHMALHEYPQALEHLRKAMQLGKVGPDVDYALGNVLGKHFEQAMYEARLSGGGDWATKQLKEIEPKYLLPAIDALQRSRAVRLDSPRYLEGLIAYYQRDYDSALRHADAALIQAPWLYEAHKLAGDVHFERALQARDSGKYPEAEKEFAGAVKRYEAAAAIGQSDSEVYDALAESWVRQIEMALNRGQPAEAAYAAAVAAGDKSSVAEPQSVGGLIKKAYAALLTMATIGAGLNSAERVKRCLAETEAALRMQPDNPYASDVAADCYAFAADGAQGRGEDPTPLFRKAIALLEPAIKRNPHFLWGLNDLAATYSALGSYFQLHGNDAAKELLEKSVSYENMALDLDSTYLVAQQNLLWAHEKLLLLANTDREIRNIITKIDEIYSNCMKINHEYAQCHINYLLAYARAAQRIALSGQDPQPMLHHAEEAIAAIRKVGGQFLDVEQHAALAHWVDASARLRQGKEPNAALAEMQTALKNCFALNAADAMCRTLAAQGEWTLGDWLALQHKPFAATLKKALSMAILATQSPETYPDAWQVLAETHLRMARLQQPGSRARDLHIAEGVAAVGRILAINPNHALGRATREALELLRAS